MDKETEEIIKRGLQEAVVEFLCEKGMLFSFISNLNKYKYSYIEEASIESVIKAYPNRKLKGLCLDFFNYCFNWHSTDEGERYWSDISSQFCAFVIKKEFYKKYLDS